MKRLCLYLIFMFPFLSVASVFGEVLNITGGEHYDTFYGFTYPEINISGGIVAGISTCNSESVVNISGGHVFDVFNYESAINGMNVTNATVDTFEVKNILPYLW